MQHEYEFHQIDFRSYSSPRFLLFILLFTACKKHMSLFLEQQDGGIPGQQGERWLVSVCCENACDVRYVRYDFLLCC